MSPRPVIHGRDHAPGGADPAFHAWEDVGGAGGGGGGGLSHADIYVTDGKFWNSGTGATTLAAGAIGFINFTPGNLFTNDPTTFTIDQYPSTAGSLKSVYGLGIHTAPGTYNFYCGLTAAASSPPASPWGRSIPFQLVCLGNTQLSGPDQSGQYMTFVPVGSAGGGYWQALFYQRVIVDNDTASTGTGGTPEPFTLEIDNPGSGSGGFTLTGCYGFIAVDKVSDDTGSWY